MRSISLFAFSLFVACQSVAFAGQEDSVSPSISGSERSPEYAVAGYVLQLVTTSEACIIESHTGNAEITKLTLNLRPPCYLLTWHQKPPLISSASSVSDGVPIGKIGEPMAWQYASAKGIVALAVIGDPVPKELQSSNLYRLRKQQNLHCTSSVQGILLRANDELRLSTKQAHTGLFCNELGLEEQDFWLLAHPVTQ